MTLGIISNATCRLHEMGASHPEQPARLDAIEERLVDSGLDAEISRHEAPKVAREQLLAAHDPRYIELVYEVAP
ncbi:MAG: histone deacetylase family protein, partial [Gammaproteobacteria bacterium]|nr:histone deacetylase family protein [Gammaproteobacteria bacterium]